MAAALSRERGLHARLVVSRNEDFVLDAELAIAPGRTVALLGPNASGKSTAVAALAGLIAIDSGRITLDDRTLDCPDDNVFIAPEKRRIGVVFQTYRLFPHLSIVENVGFGLRCRGVGRREADRRATMWLKRLGLDALLDRRPGMISGGQAQRVALARALITEPDLLLLDEPLSALDATTRVESRRVLADHLERFPGPRLLITHDPTEAFLLADEIHIIEEGSIHQVGTADDIRLRPRTRYVADLAGSNLFLGDASHGTVTTGAHPLHVADTESTGPVIAIIPARAVSIHRREPEGSPRNTWQTTLTRLEHFGDRVRVQTREPLALTAEVTPGAVEALGLDVGVRVWVSIKATEIGVESR